jgi:hypothetical protein
MVGQRLGCIFDVVSHEMTQVDEIGQRLAMTHSPLCCQRGFVSLVAFTLGSSFLRVSTSSSEALFCLDELICEILLSFNRSRLLGL